MLSVSPVNNKSLLCLESHPRGQPHVKGIPHKKQKEIKDCAAPCWLECKRKLLATLTFQSRTWNTPLLSSLGVPKQKEPSTWPSENMWGMGFIPQHSPAAQLFLGNTNLLHWLEPEHFTLGAKSKSLGGISVFACLSLCSAPSCPWALDLKEKAKIVLNALPTTIPSPPALPCQRCLFLTEWAHLRTHRALSIRQILAQSETLLAAPSCDFWLVLSPCIHAYHGKFS